MSNSDTPITISERLATAFVSTVAAAVTLLVLPWVFVAKGSSGEPLALYVWVFSKIGLTIIASTAAVGFLLGSERMTNLFSFFWGTHPVWAEDWFQKVLVGLAIAVVAGVVGYLAFNR